MPEPEKKHRLPMEVVKILITAGVSVFLTLAVTGAKGWMAVGTYTEKIAENAAKIEQIQNKDIPAINGEITSLKTKDAEFGATAAGIDKRLGRIEELLLALNNKRNNE